MVRRHVKQTHAPTRAAHGGPWTEQDQRGAKEATTRGLQCKAPPAGCQPDAKKAQGPESVQIRWGLTPAPSWCLPERPRDCQHECGRPLHTSSVSHTHAQPNRSHGNMLNAKPTPPRPQACRYSIVAVRMLMLGCLVAPHTASTLRPLPHMTGLDQIISQTPRQGPPQHTRQRRNHRVSSAALSYYGRRSSQPPPSPTQLQTASKAPPGQHQAALWAKKPQGLRQRAQECRRRLCAAP